MKDTISKFLEISILPNEILIEIENAIKLEKEKFHNYNGSQKGELNNFFGKKHTEISKAKMKEKAKARISNRIGKNHSEESKQKMSARKLGRKLSSETKEKMSLSKKDITLKEETKIKISMSNKGKTRTLEQKMHSSEIAKNRKKVVCEYCNLFLDISNYTRWHGNKCKAKDVV